LYPSGSFSSIILGMEKIDARTHNQQTQYELRKQIVRLRKKGLTNIEVAEIVGISKAHTSTVWQKYCRGGLDAIKPGKRGREYGKQRILSPEQEQEVQDMLIDLAPNQMKLPFALWTRNAVKLAIKKRYHIDLPLRTITDYLKRWGFTPQKPVKRAYEQSSEKLKKWLDESYPAIAAQARKEKAEIHWGDETGVHNQAYTARGFAPRGKAPIIDLNAKKSKVNMISTITNLGHVRFMLYRENMTSQVLIIFMSRLIKDIKQKVFLILDNLRVHHSYMVSEWLEKHKERIEVFFLPPYSPEYNPDEYLNSDLKHNIQSGLPSRNADELEKKTRSFMKTLQRRHKHVQQYFKHPLIRYAA
jgi:transposase